MTIAAFIDDMEAPRQSVTLLNRTYPDVYRDMVEAFFEPMSVDVSEATTDVDAPADAVLLHDGEDPVAVSTLDELYGSALGVNIDRYVTGDHGLDDIETPDVVTDIGPVLIPGERENKYVLTQVSRHIEAMAYKTGSGELHSGFQRLSRLTNERGTRRVYERLAATDLGVHVYGVPDAQPELPVAVHGEDCEELQDAWFIVHDGDGNDGWKGALVAEAVGPNTYRGFWTFEPSRADAVQAYVAGTYPESS